MYKLYTVTSATIKLKPVSELLKKLQILIKLI